MRPSAGAGPASLCQPGMLRCETGAPAAQVRVLPRRAALLRSRSGASMPAGQQAAVSRPAGQQAGRRRGAAANSLPLPCFAYIIVFIIVVVTTKINKMRPFIGIIMPLHLHLSYNTAARARLRVGRDVVIRVVRVADAGEEQRDDAAQAAHLRGAGARSAPRPLADLFKTALEAFAPNALHSSLHMSPVWPVQ